jgi:hypothetical protein
MHRLLAVLVAAALLAPAPLPVRAVGGPTIIGDPGPGGTPTTPLAAREAWGWLPYWTATDVETVVDLRVFHGIIYAFLSVNADGTLLASGTPRTTWESESVGGLIEATTRAGGHFAIGVSMMGWSASGEARQRALLGDPAMRATIVAETIATVSARGANAIAIDVEPIHDPAGLLALTRELRAAAPADWPILLALPADPGGLPAAELIAPDAADLGMPMFYDYRTANTAIPGNTAPLGPVASGWSVRDDMDDWAAVAPLDRLLAGIPWYGRAWSTGSDAYHAPRLTGINPLTGKAYPASTSPTWAVSQTLIEAYGATSDPEGGIYTSYETSGCTVTLGCLRTLYVDDAATHQARLEAAGLAGWRGIGVWALGYDGTRETLRQQIAAVIVDDQTPPTAAVAVFDRPVIIGAPNAVTWSVDEPVEVELQLVDATGIARRSITLAGLGTTEQIGFLDDAGARLPAGIYSARLRATDAAGNTTIVSDAFPVETRLSVTFSRGRNLTVGAVRFAAAMRGTIDLVRANPEDGDGVVLRRVATGNFARGARSYQLRGLPVGRYVLRFTMETPSGIVTSEAAFRVR